MNKMITVPCPRIIHSETEVDSCITGESDDPCEGEIEVTLEYEPADPHYGADRDGNRGMYQPGYWSGTSEDSCSEGCILTQEEQDSAAEEAASDLAAEQEADAEYYGPDCDDRDE